MRLIDADALNDSMYHEAFETDSELQEYGFAKAKGIPVKFICGSEAIKK